MYRTYKSADPGRKAPAVGMSIPMYVHCFYIDAGRLPILFALGSTIVEGALTAQQDKKILGT